ncbi:hypothetical protein V5799_017131 [Amblyomma americanum]|uniref:M13 family peptidase n=1 Tax=Amblyomma americanum TaxID=6943 RepID=A0AAQ4F3A1_AMBAM
MDTNVDPCEDFYKFTCGSWKPAGNERSLISRVFESSSNIAMQEMQSDPKLSVVPTAPQCYQSCISARTDIASELEIFKKFKQDLGLKWPERTQRADVDPLVLLLNMSINWNFHMFFNLRAFPVYKKRRQTLYIRRGLMKPKWQDLTRLQQWRANVKEHCTLLKANVADSVYTELEGIVKDLMNAAISVPPDATNDTQFELKVIEHFIQRGSHWWREQLNNFHKPEYEWTLESPVALEDETILVKLDRLLKDYADKKAALLTGFSWVFIRTNLWLIAGKPELIHGGDPSALAKTMKRACLNYVQSHFGLIISARHIYARYNSTVRSALQAFFDTLLKQTRQKLIGASWIDNGVKERAFTKLNELGFNAMPDDRFFSKVDLNRLYKDFPRIRGPFVENYIGIAKAYRRVIGHDSFVSIFSKRLGGGDASRYNYHYNIAFVSIGAMEPPVLYDDGTMAMQYGTLGTMLAQCMVRSFDSRGAFVNEKGENDAWWGLSEEYRKRINCDLLHGEGGPSGGPGSRRQSALFPSVQGLAISFQAYRDAITAFKGPSTVDQLRLEGLERFTDDQVFYLTYCLSTCAVNSSGESCNVPLRHSPKFSTTFKCPLGTPMNPRKKCQFFS